MAALELWFEFASTYSHLTVQRAEALCAGAGVPLLWRPFLLGPIFQAQGWNDSPFNIYPAKGRYMWRDLERRCERFSVPFRKPSRFPRNGLLAARVALALDGDDRQGAFIRGVYLAQFRDDAEISDPLCLTALLRACKVADPDALMARAGSEANKARLRTQTETAIAKGIFGAPSFIVGDELFWGDDRLEDAIDWATRR